MERRLTTIVATDVVGYSRLMGADEAGTLAAIKAHLQEIIEPKLAQYNGRVVKLMGDGALLEFGSVVDAVHFTVEAQLVLRQRNADLLEDKQILYRAGINIGDVIVEGNDIFGEGVNVAARLEGLAEPGGICISRPVRTQIGSKVDLDLENLGKQDIKNIAEPVTAYRIEMNDKAESLVTPIVRPEQSSPTASSESKPTRRRGSLLALAAVLLIAVVGGGVWWWAQQPDFEPVDPATMALELPRKPSIAVLPFSNMSEDKDQEYFADGMTDDLITRLANVSGLFVIARNSVFTYKGKNVKVQDVGRDLGVRYVLEGSVRRAGGTIRINAQLIDAQTGGHLWATIFDRDAADVFALQDEVTDKITDALKVTLSPAEQTRLRRKPTDNIEAFDLYLKARELQLQLDSSGHKQALIFYQEAIDKDPTFADAYARDADVASLVWLFTDIAVLSRTNARRRAEHALERALNLDPNNVIALQVQARMQSVDIQPEQAIASARKAVSLEPGSSSSHAMLAVVLAAVGQTDEALKQIDAALRLNPNPNAADLSTASFVNFHGRRYARAAKYARGAVERAPNSPAGYFYLAPSLARLGKQEQAREAVKAILRQIPNFNLRWPRYQFGHFEDRVLENYLEALRLAGVPERPYGFTGDKANLLTTQQVRELMWGHKMEGHTKDQGPFKQTILEDGRWIFRYGYFGGDITGRYVIDGDEYCVIFDGGPKGRRTCERYYRNPTGTRKDKNEFLIDSPWDTFSFSVVE